MGKGWYIFRGLRVFRDNNYEFYFTILILFTINVFHWLFSLMVLAYFVLLSLKVSYFILIAYLRGKGH